MSTHSSTFGTTQNHPEFSPKPLTHQEATKNESTSRHIVTPISHTDLQGTFSAALDAFGQSWGRK